MEGISLILCLTANILRGNRGLVILLNVLIFGLSIFVFKIKNRLFLPLLAIAPIFSFDIKQIQISFLLIIFLGLIFLTQRIKTGKNIVLIVALIIFMFGNLLGAKIINWPLSIDKSQITIYMEPIKNTMIQHQKDTVFLPYKLRMLIYNPFIYIYYGLANIFHLFTLKNLIDVIFIVNIYPLIVGLLEAIKNKKEKWWWIFGISGLIIMALDKSTDKFNSLYFLLPIIMYLIATGLEKIKKL